MARAAGKQMLAQGKDGKTSGKIVLMSSARGLLGHPAGYSAYCASKSAVDGITKALGCEWGDTGITVNAILPGATFTEIERKTVSPEQKVRIIAQQCISRAETPDDLVGTALFLASDSSAFLTGQCLTVDGGATHR